MIYLEYLRGQQPCNLLEQNKLFTQEKTSTPKGFLWDTNMAAAMSGKNSVLIILNNSKEWNFTQGLPEQSMENLFFMRLRAKYVTLWVNFQTKTNKKIRTIEILWWFRYIHLHLFGFKILVRCFGYMYVWLCNSKHKFKQDCCYV